jgi:hypothetical protein
MNANYPSILFEVLQHLQHISFDFSGGSHEDGRIVSIEKERDVIAALQEKFDCDVPSARCWYDVALVQNDVKIHCNIKISKGSTDNANQKKRNRAFFDRHQ